MDAGTAMRSSITVVTPEDAERLLARNGHNRNVSEQLVERYARDMRCGAWKLNGEPILIGSDGTLLDGQHRLLAIQRAGMAQTLLIVRGIDPAVFDSIDQGRARTFADVLSIRGDRKHATKVAAVLRYVAVWEQAGCSLTALWEGRQRPGSGSWRSKLLTVHDIEEVRDRHPWVPDMVARVRSSRRLVTLMPPALLAFLAHVFSLRDAAAMDQFLGGLETGADLDVNDPVYQLRERLLALRVPDRAGMQRRVSERVYAGLTVKTWNRLRRGRTAASLQFGADEAVPEAL